MGQANKINSMCKSPVVKESRKLSRTREANVTKAEKVKEESWKMQMEKDP